MNQFKPYVAEIFGTTVLTLGVLLSLGGALSAVSPLETPFVAALILGLFVYTIGTISGCHLNPAVTLALLSRGQIDSRPAIQYIGAQFLGGIIALGLFHLLTDVDATMQYTLFSDGSTTIFWAELFGTMLFTFGIAAVISGSVPKAMSGLVIGGSLLLGITFASIIGSTGILNPAVAIALGGLTLSHIAGICIGGILGMWIYHFMVTN